ncbi:MAG: MerR family transcriptional regulator [Chloroflexi bacterium]|nr:MerR family transcriptional regulator [Chloroflexota bacterium]
MKERIMLKIGEFARVGQVTIATLRHYDQYGLLKPSALDPDSGYRYYSLDQLPRLNRIVALRDLGFPLEQIAQLLEEDLSLEYLQGMFRLKQAQIQQVIDTEQARLMRIAARLRQIQQEGNMPTYEVRLKQVEPLLVASIREIVSIEDGPGRLQRRISAYLEQQGIQRLLPDVLLWYSRYELHDDGVYAADMEIAIPLPSSLAGNEQVRVRTLPGGLMASTIHTGYALSVGQAHAALHGWIANNGYRLIGPVRQIYLQRAEHMDPRHYVTEMQFQVEKQEV